MDQGKDNSEDFYKSLPTYEEGFHDENLCRKMTYTSFGNSGLIVSVLGFGGSELALIHDTAEEPAGVDAVVKALKSGINYIDTAPYYGQGKAEIVLGKALKDVPRHTYYLATKVGRYGARHHNMFDFSGQRTLQSVEESLDRMGLDYIDVLQIHDLEFCPDTDIILNETLPTLSDLKEKGKIKLIGITGYSLSKLEEVLEKSSINIDAVLSCCRCTLYDNGLKSYMPSFKEKNLAVINAAVLGMGLLTSNGPPDWHPAGSELKEACKQAAKYCDVENLFILKVSVY